MREIRRSVAYGDAITLLELEQLCAMARESGAEDSAPIEFNPPNPWGKRGIGVRLPSREAK